MNENTEQLASDFSGGELERVQDLLRDLFDGIKADHSHLGTETPQDYLDIVDAVAGYFGEPNPFEEV